jgi:hypothetical protein
MEIKAYEKDKRDITNLQASWIHFWKRVRKSDGIAKFLRIVDVKLQAPFHHQITRSHLHCRFVKMQKLNPSLPSPSLAFPHTTF